MTVYSAAQHKLCLLEALRRQAGVIELDLAGVTEIDTAGVQLLLLAQRLAAAAGGAVRLRNPSAAVRSTFALLGLEPLFANRGDVP